MLIPKWQGKIAIPALPDRTVRVGKNQIVQHPTTSCPVDVEVFDSVIAGHDLLRTELPAPFNEIYFRHKGAKRQNSDTPVLVGNVDYDGEGYSGLAWDNLGALDQWVATPEAVLEEWRGGFEFRLDDPECGESGLRKPQIGALHALAAHFSVGSEFDPATVVLPTGTGKTETMLAWHVYGCLPKVLVIVPTDALRTQIAEKFETLGKLPDIGVVPARLPRPFVTKIKSGLKCLDEAKEIIEKSNVVVTLPDTLSASDPEGVKYLLDHCTDLFVDEAHHITAPKWSAIRDKFGGSRIAQFTATPFRRDNKRIDGKIIFNFKLGDAQDADYYKPIQLIAVEEYGEQRAKDRAIAAKAIAALRKDRDELGLDHLLMARTQGKKRANAVWAIYEELASDLRPQIVYSGSGRTTANNAALAAIKDRGPDGARIIVCVDMLGEGYDLPNLKVAALHDTHKSLAITLQFIGRFTRTGNPELIGDASVVVNIADPETERKLEGLYAEGADWDRIIRRLSEDRISAEISLQDVVESLKVHGDLHKHLSLWNLRPAFSAQIFRTRCAEWSPERFDDAIPSNAECWHSINKDRDVLVAVVHRMTSVNWGKYQDLENSTYDLLVLRWDKAEGALFVYASDYDGLRSTTVAKTVTDENTELVSGPAIFNILNNVELPLVKNLGSSSVGAISFMTYFGPNVTEGLASIEKAESALSHIACVGYEDGDRVLWGGAQKKGKVWQRDGGPISEWIDWTRRTWEKVSDDSELDANITRDFLRPIRLSAPHASEPISVQWGEQAQQRVSDQQTVVFGSESVPSFMVDFALEAVTDDGAIEVAVCSGDLKSVYVLRISDQYAGGYFYEHLSGPPVLFQVRSGDPVPMTEYWVKDPPIIRYADGTHSYNCYHIPMSIDAGEFPRDRLETWDWSNVPLNQESMGKARQTDTIQHRSFEYIRDEYDLIFNDDGSGEAADLVALKNLDDETVRLTLVHCKNAVGGSVSGDIRNFYTLCGQAQKCIRVKHGGLGALYADLKRREERWAAEGASRFLKGDMKQLAFFRDKARRSKLSFEVVIVQPGVTPELASDDILKLLGTTELYLAKTAQAGFRVITSRG